MPENTTPTIECKGCGRDFEPTGPRQKYCPECRADGYKKAARTAREIHAATRRNFRNHYDLNVQVKTSPCEACGKPIKYIDYGGNTTPSIPKYCCRDCQAKAHIASTTCAICGKPMSETNDQYDVNGHVWTCGPECAEKHRWDLARQAGNIGTCPVCGREFIGRNSKTFCSKECYRKTVTGQPLKDPVMEHVCPVCGKTYTGKASRKYCSLPCSRKGQALKADAEERTCPVCGKTYKGKARCCSASCYGKYTRREKAAEAASLREGVLNAEKQKELNYVLKNGLCGVCSTPYPDCRRMQTGFTYSPEHALHRNGVIVYCPQFRSSQIKVLTDGDMERLASEVRQEARRKLANEQARHGE